MTATRRRLGEVGWTLETPGEVPRDEALARLGSAHGLLLLCAAEAAIPSKAFEYLCVRRPVLAVTGAAGALWEACRDVPQVFLTDPAAPDPSRVNAFLQAAAGGMSDGTYERPERFGEAALGRTFLDALGLGEAPVRQPAAAEG